MIIGIMIAIRKLGHNKGDSNFKSNLIGKPSGLLFFIAFSLVISFSAGGQIIDTIGYSKPILLYEFGAGAALLEDRSFNRYFKQPLFALRWNVIKAGMEYSFNSRVSFSAEIAIPILVTKYTIEDSPYRPDGVYYDLEEDLMVLSGAFKYNGLLKSFDKPQTNKYLSLYSEALFREKVAKGGNFKNLPYYYSGIHAGVQQRLLRSFVARFEIGLGLSYWTDYNTFSGQERRTITDFTGRISCNISYRAIDGATKHTTDTLSVKRLSFKINALLLSPAVEVRIADEFSFYNQIGFIPDISWGIFTEQAFGKKVNVSFTPWYMGSLRYYYNMNRRILHHKRTGSFSANYIALQTWYAIGGDRFTLGENFGAPYNSYAFVTGLQRKFAKRFYFDINAGYGLWAYRGDQLYDVAGFIGIGYAFN